MSTPTYEESRWWAWVKSTKAGGDAWGLHLFKTHGDVSPFHLASVNGELVVYHGEPVPPDKAFCQAYAAGMWHSFGRGTPSGV